ncbi:hypothetical protein [Modicisalibacter luteus]|uniref:VWA domain-containing protein n=2 Tax=Modicisalibacter luteus TaxID=453962 RepID=A0ABV7M807_9GAMM|nr:hypothetical protein [Halomonas lutea]GHA99415.1 hypothetical protein GCM10007159_21500 [Halomonas lutea]
MMRYFRPATALLAGLLLSLLPITPAQAAERDDFPSCYGMLGDAAPTVPASPRALFVIIDETVAADDSLKRAVVDKTLRYLRPGDDIIVARFAAYIGEHYTQLPLKGQLDPTLDEEARFSISKRALVGFDGCMSKQSNFVKQRVTSAILESFNPNEDIPKTELLGNLSSLSEVVANNEAPRKTVLLFSDMLENSDLTTFYRQGAVRVIEPDAELAKLDASGIQADWGGASIYIMGAGLVGDTSAYRSKQALSALRSFWTGYFQRSQATLKGWGEPMLMVELQ